MGSQSEGKSKFLGPARGKVDLLVIAAEHSGDEHGARLVEEFKRTFPDQMVCAIGGQNLAKVADQFLFNLAEHSALGIVEVLRQISFFHGIFHEILQWIRRYRPRRVCFIDSPALHLRLAAELYRQGISNRSGGDVKLFYYISPQIWAWKAKRRFSMARHLDALGVIFPFEVEAFKDTALPVEFLGHPFLQRDHLSPIKYAANRRVLLLPGSRRQNIERIFPVILQTFLNLSDLKPEGVCLYPSESIKLLLEKALKEFPQCAGTVKLLPIEEARREPISARLALVSSGTMSLQCALEGIPGVILYRTHPLTYWLGKKLVKVKYLGIANLLLGYEIYPEYIQYAAKSDVIGKRLHGLWHARAEFQEVAGELKSILQGNRRTPAKWLAEESFLR